MKELVQYEIDRRKIYKYDSVSFSSAINFIKEALGNGDYFIPLGGKLSSGEKFSIDYCEEYKEEYDPVLLKLYQRQENNLVQRNIKTFGNADTEDKGYSTHIKNFIDRLDKLIDMIPTGIINMISKKTKKLYDQVVGRNMNRIPSIYIWIPLWNSNAEIADVLVFLSRIVIIIT